MPRLSFGIGVLDGSSSSIGVVDYSLLVPFKRGVRATRMIPGEEFLRTEGVWRPQVPSFAPRGGLVHRRINTQSKALRPNLCLAKRQPGNGE